ncbi:hypothetical protein EDD11_001054 [Mortierella claussenii]|nr:hypothetical protein EDD11_001054 [Mortierella claussenii]
MLSQHSQPPTLAIIAHGATVLKDVETFGKQDPYLRFSLDYNNAKSFQKTFVHKNAGKTPVWNQSFTVPLQGEPELYIEIMDEEKTADAVIAFAAIPIQQVVHAPGGTLNGLFAVFAVNGKPNGDVNLTLTAHNVPGQNSGYGGQAAPPATPIRGQSHIVEAHQRRMKSLNNKEAAADAGMAIAGGLLALGAGLLANKISGDQKKEEQERKEQEMAREHEKERFEQEKKKLEMERSEFERTQSEERTRWEQQQQMIEKTTSTHSETRREQHHQQQHHHEGHSHEHGHEHGHGHHHDPRKWDSVGSYAAGDKVSYHGRTYVCLQGHQSNPTWEPTQAHSLWRGD